MRGPALDAERRKLFAVGRMPADHPRMLVLCAWCPAVIQVGSAGAPTTHSICPSCMTRHFPEDCR